jgi:hypothetical protein
MEMGLREGWRSVCVDHRDVSLFLRHRYISLYRYGCETTYHLRRKRRED